MSFANFPPEFIEHMNSLQTANKLMLPPPIFTEMAGEFLSLDLTEKTIAICFPVREQYQNPMGYMQGGMIATALDNAIGPLSFMVAPPSVTKKMEITYLRPISTRIASIIVEAQLERQEGVNLFLSAQVGNGKGTTFATALSHNVIRKRRGR
ncbi:MAG: PaaI family thioesterase [Chloroflexi bacterium]|nr:PaaI family thioesterase [Chloroflexota bacterium]